MTKENAVERDVYTATEARTKFADLFNDAHYGRRVIVRKHDREVAIVPMEVLEQLERLAELEAALDSMKAELALSDFQKKGGKTMKEIKQELEMD